jgi:glycosyltransferase involved in cell wall biosynthesis
MFGFGDWSTRTSERVLICRPALLKQHHLLVGITRVRNESLLLADTLAHVSEHVGAIVAYDDASTDNTLEFLLQHPKVAIVIQNTQWESTVAARLTAETRHRGLLLRMARAKLKFDWAYCFDADERLIGDVHGFLCSPAASAWDGLRVQLFDAYMTPDDQAPYIQGQRLLNFRHFFGPERRDILMLWRNTRHVRYRGLDAREPHGVNRISTQFHCQHYGKSISTVQWEETCDYYIRHFPAETYGYKWQARKGKAIHETSDFSRTLLPWGPVLFEQAVSIYP